jgi:hypothetical protein
MVESSSSDDPKDIDNADEDNDLDLPTDDEVTPTETVPLVTGDVYLLGGSHYL